MANKIEELENDIKYLKTHLNEHIGETGEDVHGLPVKGNAGFMPFDLYEKNKQLFQKRKWVTNMSVNDLTPGFYYCAYMKDIPTDAEPQAMATIDVSVYEDSRKQIVYTQGMMNRTWKKMLHAPFATPSDRGWFRVVTSKIIWSGFLQDTDKPQVLVEPINRFREIEIMYQTTSGNLCYTKFDANHRTCTLEALNIPDTGTVASVCGVEANLDFNDVSKFNVKSNHSSVVSASSASNADIKIIMRQINGIL